MANRPSKAIMEEREATLRAIEKMAEELHANGACRQWYVRRSRWVLCSDASMPLRRRCAATDPAVRSLISDINGPLMEVLADRIRYHDRGCIELFRQGAPIVGKLVR